MIEAIVIWLLILILIVIAYRLVCINPPGGKHTWECGYCSFRGTDLEVVNHVHKEHQAIFDKEDFYD